MMELNIINNEFELLGKIEGYTSLIAGKSWHGIGTGELHLHEDLLHAKSLEKEHILFTKPNKAYIISTREMNSVDGNMIVRGDELKAYLHRWLIYPPVGMAYHAINSNAETIMKAWVQDTLDRKGITNIVVAPNQSRGETIYAQARYERLSDKLEEVSKMSGLGWDIRIDWKNKQFVFDCFEGVDRVSNQSINSPAIFSLDFENILEQHYTDSNLDYANTAVVGGFGELEHQVIEVVGEDGAGLNSREIFVDASDIVYDEFLADRGTQELSLHKELKVFESNVESTKSLRFESDFDLGDMVTIRNKNWNITENVRITEAVKVFESTGYRLDVTFGEGLPTLIERIKKEVV